MKNHLLYFSKWATFITVITILFFLITNSEPLKIITNISYTESHTIINEQNSENNTINRSGDVDMSESANLPEKVSSDCAS